MNCPNCHKEMVSEDFGVGPVQVCENGCMGLWLEWMEIGKLDANNKGFGDYLTKALAVPRASDAERPALQCPNCQTPLHRHLFHDDKGVTIDECYNCGGMFLDAGELKDIREHHMTEAESETYNERLLANVPEYQGAEMNLELHQARARAMMNFSNALGGYPYNPPI